MDYVFQTCYKVENDKKSVPSNIIDKPLVFSPLHRNDHFLSGRGLTTAFKNAYIFNNYIKN